MQTNLIAAPAAPPQLSQQRSDQRLEQVFLEEMLKYAGPKPSKDMFGGGIGEEQFSTFLTREYAALLADSIDFGFSVGRKEAS
ncbi:flagellar biosynthesis protein FlgJ [Paracoccus tegillarcae]|nr:flagellar biosynthesis protein FlgJ [Paracoccus tegillarcae]